MAGSVTLHSSTESMSKVWFGPSLPSLRELLMTAGLLRKSSVVWNSLTIRAAPHLHFDGSTVAQQPFGDVSLDAVLREQVTRDVRVEGPT